MRFNTVSAAAIIASALGFAGVARAQTTIEQSVEHRFQLDFHVNEEALQKMLPAGWEPDVATAGAAKDANIRLIFVDRIELFGPDGKPKKGSSRLAFLASPVKQKDGAGKGQMILGGLTEDAADAPGAFGNFQKATTSKYRRTMSNEGAGAMSDGDLLKVKLQLLQYQMDVSAAKLARVLALANLRQLLGHESMPANYEVAGDLQYLPVTAGEDDLKALALKQRPDLMAAQLGVTAAQNDLSLAQANGKKDLTVQLNYTHVAATSTASLFGSVQVPLFDRNQGEIARNRSAVTQSQELSSEQSSIVATDVENAYEALRTSAEVVTLYQSGYLKQARDSRDISQYGYQHGAASLLDFLDAERSYRATELAYRQALASYMIAVEQLRQAVGTRSVR